MIGLIIDIVIVLVIALCAYRGFRSGIVRGVAGFLVLLLSLVIASVVSSTFAGEFVGVVQPFVGGLVDSQIQKILAPDDDEIVVVTPDATEDNATASDTSDETETTDSPSEDAETHADDGETADTEAPDETSDEPEILDILPGSLSEFVDGFDIKTTRDLAMLTLKNLGFIDAVSGPLADSIAKETKAIGVALGDAITAKLSLMLTRIALFAVAFILLAMILAVIGNLITLVFELPGLKMLDQVSGAVVGALRGLLIMLFVAAVLRYFGLVTTGFVEKTTLLEYLVLHNPIANLLKF